MRSHSRPPGTALTVPACMVSGSLTSPYESSQICAAERSVTVEFGEEKTHERRVGGARLQALVVEEAKQRERLALEERDDGRVVGVLDARDIDPFAGVLLLHEADRRRREVRLQLLVGEVDQQLLERVGLEDLRAKDVEEADRADRAGGRAAEAVVDDGDEAIEDTLVNRLCQRVARRRSLRRRFVELHLLAARRNRPLRQRAQQRPRLDAEQCCRRRRRVFRVVGEPRHRAAADGDA